MIHYFSWGNFNNIRLYVSLAVILICISLYLFIIVLDFKYKEMEFSKILLAGSCNIILPFIPIAIWGCKCMVFILPGAAIAWIILLILNLKFNKETIVGRADIDILGLQIILLIAICIWVMIKIKSQVNILILLTMLQTASSSLFIGLTSLIIFWIIKILLENIKLNKGIDKTSNKRITFRKSIKNNKKVPSLVAFLPLIIVNLYVILKI